MNIAALLIFFLFALEDALIVQHPPSVTMSLGFKDHNKKAEAASGFLEERMGEQTETLDFYHYALDALYQPKVEFDEGKDVTIQHWFKQLGNNLIQACNAIEIAENEGGRVFLPPRRREGGFWEVFDAPKNHMIEVEKVDKPVVCRAIGNKAGSFPRFGNQRGENNTCFSQDERHRVMDTYLRPLLKPCSVDVDPEELVIHIRGGDNFLTDGMTTHFNEGTQPPCAAYDAVIQKEGFTKIRIVASDDKNPCVAEIQNRHADKTVTLQNQGILVDFMTLVNAQHLFMAYSTFSLTAYTMSNKATNTFAMRELASRPLSNFLKNPRKKKSGTTLTLLEAPEQGLQQKKEVDERIDWMKRVKASDIQFVTQSA